MLKKPGVIFQIILFAIIIYLRYFNQTVEDILDRNPMIYALMAFLIFYLFIKLLSIVIIAYYARRNNKPFKKKDNVHFGIENIANILIAFGFIGFVLRLFGVDPFEIITSATIVAAAIALVTRDYIADFLSGIYLSFSNTFGIGDYVKLDNHKGRIIEIGMLKIKILNDDDDLVIMPNFKVYFNEIINYTRRDARIMSIDFQVGLKNVISIEELEKDLIRTLEGFSEYIMSKSYNLKVVEMKADHLEMKFQYKLKNIDPLLQREIRKKTMREVFNYISVRSQKREGNSTA
ncbi:mechanosensitive ion channel [Cryomorpha ignava]|uniref:Mechanosensitive ion channel n=1 Tax=Cryomorpha ignava TaxID=101383 RepID=A0A7K3WRY3_9FLAO|nr:mechanosensitive ion channel domain-containing protein [Cryomorpha ignava]NEN24244.1 mechanosensitive ion channel [Cryomorpha ignava]